MRALQARGTGIETLMLHFELFFFSHSFENKSVIYAYNLRKLVLLGWPSGLRRLTQVQVSSDAWVRIPLQAFLWEKKALGGGFQSVDVERGPLV